MTRSATPRITAYAAIAGVLLLGALAIRRPELVAVAAPFVTFLVVGLLISRPAPLVRVGVHSAPESAMEGEPLDVTLELETSPAIRALEVTLPTPPGLELVRGDPRIVIGLEDQVPREIAVRLRASHWGVYTLGRVRTRTYDEFHLFRFDGSADISRTLRVYPGAETMRTLMRPRRTLALAGNRVARQKGDGLEFADIRPYGPGDRVRSINWRASARRGALWINERHPERNVDVVLLLDTFTHVSSAAGSTLDEMIRGGAGLAAAWLGARDRVSVVGFGGVLQWLEGGSGVRHAYRVVDALMHTRLVFSYAAKGIGAIPPRLLPPGALIAALTPMLDDRMIAALLDLRARGADLVVIEISPEPFIPAATSPAESLARRLWNLEREALRFRCIRAGIPVVTWSMGMPLESVVVEVEAWRRHQHLRAG
jgi:uncharacterized protein (DUF58 family)